MFLKYILYFCLSSSFSIKHDIFKKTLLNKQLDKLKTIINTEDIIQPEITILTRYIKFYLDEICGINFLHTDAANSCILKNHWYRRNACVFVLICNHLDENYINYKTNLKVFRVLENVKMMKYCNKMISNSCDKCYKISDCKQDNQNITNVCDYKSLYTCIKFDDHYVPIKHYCKNYYNGTICL